MQDPNAFFSDFPPVSKAQWLEQIARDLKDKPVESLRWQAGPGLLIDPLVHADDFAQRPPDAEDTLRWEIAETIPADTPGAVNARALEAPDWRYLAELIQHGAAALPHVRLVHLDATGASVAPADAVEHLADLLHRANRCFEKLSERGIAPETTAANLHVSMAVGSSYFFDMARLRAFRLLWLHLLQAWGVAPEYPELDVFFHPSTYTDELYKNMIKAATMAMSAVLGGATRLYVTPYDAGREAQATYPPAFGRRIARNVQHLLKMESSFEALSADPAAGSYYIETLTNQLAASAFERFKAMQA